MRRRCSKWFCWSSWAFLLCVAVSARAAENSVVVACDALTLDEAAELEARTRASLLADGPEGTEVRVRCEPDVATIIAVSGEQSESAVVRLPTLGLKEALLAAVDRTLAAAKQHGAGTSGVIPAEPMPAPPPLAPPPPLPPPAPLPDAGVVPAVPSRPARLLRVGAAALIEPWDGKPAFGGRAKVVIHVHPWSAGVALGGLTSTERAQAFVPTEWHAVVNGAFDLDAVGGLRVSAAAGVSVLLASPRAGLSNESGTSLTRAFFELGLARPLHVGRVAMTPELDLRLFTTEREVLVDGSAVFTLPVASPLGQLTVSYEL
jgi:hypothetical protein